MVDKDRNLKEPQLSAKEIEERLKEGLARAVESITGDATQNPIEVFPNPADKERRQDIEFGVELSEDQEVAFRDAMSEIGIGRETNRDAATVGLEEGYLALLEGGQSHKMLAELNITSESVVKLGVIIMSGDSERAISDKEQTLTAKVLGLSAEDVGTTEYEVAEQVFRAHHDFVAQEEVVLPYGYTIDGKLTHESTGQFRQIGMVGDVPAVVMRIDREWHEDEAGNRSFKRPDNFAKMCIISEVDGVDSIGFVTSSTYQPSNEIDAIRASKATDVVIKVPTYGTAELAIVKQESMPEPPALNQLAGEAYKASQQLSRLEA